MERELYAEAIEKKLEALGFMFQSRRFEEGEVFEVVFPSEAEPEEGLWIQLMLIGNGNIELGCSLARDVEQEKRSALFKELNRLNAQNRFACLSVNEEGRLCVTNDFILLGEEESAAEQAVCTLATFARITDDCALELLPWLASENGKGGEGHV